MTNHSEPAGPAPTENAGLNWNWLSDRVAGHSLSQFDSWISSELADLVVQHETMITVNSRKRSARRESNRTADKSDSTC